MLQICEIEQVGEYKGETVYRDDTYYFTDSWKRVRATKPIGKLNNEALNGWRERIGKDAADAWTEETREIGSQVHGFLDKIAKGFSFNESSGAVLEWGMLDNRIRNGLRAAQQAELTLGFKTVQSEMLLVSEKFDYAGTTDRLVRYRGGSWLLDYKVSSDLWPEVEYQAASYWNAYLEQTGKSLDGFIALRLDRDTGKWTPHDMLMMTPNQLDRKFPLYVGLLNIWKEKHESL